MADTIKTVEKDSQAPEAGREAHATPASAPVSLSIEGMTCASCALRIEKGLKKLPGVTAANVNLATEQATVTYDPNLVALDDLLKKVSDVGYSASPLTSTPAPAPVSPAPAAAEVAPTERGVELNITGMTCASCVRRVERALSRTPGVSEANVNLATERATVTFQPGETRLEDLIAAVEKAGYGAEEIVSAPAPAVASVAAEAPAPAPMTSATEQLAERRRVDLRRRRDKLIVGIALTIPVTILSMFFMNAFPGENCPAAAADRAGLGLRRLGLPSDVAAGRLRHSAPIWTCWSASARPPPS